MMFGKQFNYYLQNKNHNIIKGKPAFMIAGPNFAAC